MEWIMHATSFWRAYIGLAMDEFADVPNWFDLRPERVTIGQTPDWTFPRQNRFRLPITDPIRIQQHDYKLWIREQNREP
jgi:hypothetical protein